jgi:hypothetical protein
MFGPIPGSPSIDKALKIEPWARRDVLSTLCPLNVRSCVAGACTYLQQIPDLEHTQNYIQDDGWTSRPLCKVLAHETAHLFGLAQCIFFNCVTNGSNHQG